VKSKLKLNFFKSEAPAISDQGFLILI
jgi:hypothetical protein